MMLRPFKITFKTPIHNEEDIRLGIYKEEERALNSLIKTQYIPIKKMVYSFRNASLDPDDVFQEGLTRTIMNIRAGKFKGESSVSTYLNSICRNICLKLISRRKILTIEESQLIEEPESNNYYDLLILISELKEKTGNNCCEILDLRFKKSNKEQESCNHNKLLDFNEIAQILNITADNARQRLKRCLDQLRELVLSHPIYQEFLD